MRLLIVLLICINGYSQNYKAEYTMMGHNLSSLTYKGVLLFNNNKASYIYKCASEEENTIYNKDKTEVTIYSPDSETYEIYIDKKSGFLTEKQWVGKIYTKEPMKINWTFSTEQKKILGYTCTKAFTNFRGRNYTAWYTSEIPTSFGPWKLQGLPGLILEAYDDSKIIKFNLKSIKKLKVNKIPQVDLKKNIVQYSKYVVWRDKDFKKRKAKLKAKTKGKSILSRNRMELNYKDLKD